MVLDAAAEAVRALETLGQTGTVRAIKLYRLTLPQVSTVPILPCLDHEAMLHANIHPHVAAYLQDSSGSIHELSFVPAIMRIEVDTMSTWGECTPEARTAFVTFLRSRFQGWTIVVNEASYWRGDRRVAEACRAQITLREVLLGDDVGRIKTSIERLQTVGALMEKQSRVASWGVRTVTGPLLAAAGVVTFLVLGSLSALIGEGEVAGFRYAVISVLGAWFLYYGLKAVQLTDMSNRVWKRSVEYQLILAERRRLSEATSTSEHQRR